MKQKISSNAIAVCILVFSTMAGCKIETLIINNSPSTGGKPDLTISQVTATKLPNCIEGYPSGIICYTGRFQFTLRIWNIGTATLARPFFISNSRSSPDIRDSICSTGRLVNERHVAIYPGDFVDISFEGSVDDSVPQVFFVINTNDRFSKGVHLPIIPELRYDNNDYWLDLHW